MALSTLTLEEQLAALARVIGEMGYVVIGDTERDGERWVAIDGAAWVPADDAAVLLDLLENEESRPQPEVG